MHKNSASPFERKFQPRERIRDRIILVVELTQSRSDRLGIFKALDQTVDLNKS